MASDWLILVDLTLQLGNAKHKTFLDFFYSCDLPIPTDVVVYIHCASIEWKAVEKISHSIWVSVLNAWACQVGQ